VSKALARIAARFRKSVDAEVRAEAADQLGQLRHIVSQSLRAWRASQADRRRGPRCRRASAGDRHPYPGPGWQPPPAGPNLSLDLTLVNSRRATMPRAATTTVEEPGQSLSLEHLRIASPGAVEAAARCRPPAVLGHAAKPQARASPVRGASRGWRLHEGRR